MKTCGKVGPLGIRCEAPAGHDKGPHPTFCYGAVPVHIPEIEVLAAAVESRATFLREHEEIPEAAIRALEKSFGEMVPMGYRAQLAGDLLTLRRPDGSVFQAFHRDDNPGRKFDDLVELMARLQMLKPN